MDVIYPYRRALDEFELRFSLRSLNNLPHSRVIVAGERSRILTRFARQVIVRRIRNPYQCSTNNVVQAIQHEGVTGDFVLMNDDFFVMQPWKSKLHYRCTMQEYLDSGLPKRAYREAIERTMELLAAHGVADPKFYGVHGPVIMDAGKLLDVVRDFEGETYLLKSLYFNLHPQRASKRKDVKLHAWEGVEPTGDIVSTSDKCGRDPLFRQWLANKFPEPSRYEAKCTIVRGRFWL